MPTHETVAQHTPGPWQLEVTTPENHPDRLAAWGLVKRPHCNHLETNLADARLIAAAPDMRAALTDALEYLELTLGPCDPGCDCIIHTVAAALVKATRAAAVALLLLLVASSAFAQERPSFARPLAVYAAGAALDVHSTYRALHYNGVKELNPLAAWADARPATFVVVAVAEDVAIVWALHRWIAPTRPTLFRVGLYAVGALRVGIAARNYRIDPSRERVR